MMQKQRGEVCVRHEIAADRNLGGHMLIGLPEPIVF